MEGITLVCTSLNPNKELLNKMLVSAKEFDNIFLNIVIPSNPNFILYASERNKFFSKNTPPVHLVLNEDIWSIPDAYNWMIKRVATEWVCCFCDDDYVYPDGLAKMIEEVHKGIDADVAHFNFRISGYCPPQDKRAWLFGPRYTLGEKKPITPKLLSKHNRLPAGAFFRKSAWEKVGGFQGDKMHDWDLWKRMAKFNCNFKYFDYLVYNLVRRPNSAWIKQNRE